jgi:polysaccharide biosynthesis transport protein
MTLRQILDVLWKRKWIIVSVLVVAVVTAVVYLQVRTETYQSSGTLRLNAVVTDAAYSGEIGGAGVDVDPVVIRSPAITEPAAEAIGEDAGTVAGSLSVTADAESRLGRLTITAQGPTAAVARDRAQAVMAAYQEYVDQQVDAALVALQQMQQDAIATAQELQPGVNENPADSIAQANLQTAVQQMTAATAAINTVNNAGATTIVLTPPADGSSTVPSMVIVLLLALGTGLVVGIAAALIRDQFDDRLRGEDEVQGLAGVRPLGELNWDRNVARGESPLPAAGNDRTDLSERLRTLRTTLQVFLPPHGAAFVVTSVEPGDGKSFISANLAMAWSRAGKRVILVGGDLRRPGLARYFGDAADGEGVTEILAERDDGSALDIESIQSRLNSTGNRRLRILPAGTEPPDPADLLARPVTADLIAKLREMADVVVIDSPPAIGMADAGLLASHTDGAVVVASIRRTGRERLIEASNALRASGADILGAVANRSRRALPKTYASYYVGNSAPTSSRSDRTRDERPADRAPADVPDVTDPRDEELSAFLDDGAQTASAGAASTKGRPGSPKKPGSR